MSFFRSILVLLIFFALLYSFKSDQYNVASSVKNFGFSYSEPLKKSIMNLWNSTSTVEFNGSFENGTSTASSSILDISNPAVSSAKANSTSALSQDIRLETKGELLPVISNQQQINPLGIHGIVAYTNFERSKQGIPALKVDAKLTLSAESKLQDMFKNQYFKHISLSGESVSDVVRREKYEYIVVGENLALGVFGGNEYVVEAWMASPGHKRNILDARYQDIGVAVGQGMYQGKKQWLIVQHFGKPLSSCTSPASSIKKSIDEKKQAVSALESKISSLKPEIDKSTGDEYRAKAAEYNTLVVEYNTKLESLKKEVDAYNDSVRSFNICAGILNT